MFDWDFEVEYGRDFEAEFLRKIKNTRPRMGSSGRIQFGRVHLGVFSTSRSAPPSLYSEWILLFKCGYLLGWDRRALLFFGVLKTYWQRYDNSSVVDTAWESDHFSSLTGGPNWPPGHSLRKWSFSVTLFRHPRGGPNWPFICLDYFMSNIMRMFGSCFVIKSRILLTLKNHFHNSVLKRNMALGLQELLFKRAFGGLFVDTKYKMMCFHFRGWCYLRQWQSFSFFFWFFPIFWSSTRLLRGQ